MNTQVFILNKFYFKETTRLFVLERGDKPRTDGENQVLKLYRLFVWGKTKITIICANGMT